MIALYRPAAGHLRRVAMKGRHWSAVAEAAWASAARFSMRIWMAASILLAVNGHIDETRPSIAGNHGYAQPPHLS